MKILGFIGTGDLAEYTIKGLRNGGYTGRILLSPRNLERSKSLATQCACEVQSSNQAVVDACDSLILSTRPEHCHEALGQIKLRPGQLLISVVAGVSIESLKEAAGDEVEVIRAMPVNCAEAVASPTLIYPDNKLANSLFNYCGQSIVASDESAFEQGSVLACVYTWFFALFEELIQSTSGATLNRESATELVLGMAKGAASLALQDKNRSPGEIAKYIATEGTYSKLGLDLLDEKNAFGPWNDACQLLIERLKQE